MKAMPVEASVVEKRIGVAKGIFEVPEDIDTYNDAIAQLFQDGKLP